MCSLIRFWQEIQKFKSCRVWSCFLRNFIVAKKSKNVEIVFSIPKAKSESISIKIRQPLFWTDPYLPDLLRTPIYALIKQTSSGQEYFSVAHSCHCVSVLCGPQPCNMKIDVLSLNRTRCIFGSDKQHNFGKLCKCNNPTFSLLQSPIAGLWVTAATRFALSQPFQGK